MLKKLLLIDPVEVMLLNDTSISGTDLVSEDGSGPASRIDGSTDSDLLQQPASPMESLHNFVKRLLECKANLVLCKKHKLISCYLYCLLNKHPIGKVVKTTVVSLVKTLCAPLGTICDTGVRLFNKQFENIRTIQHYLTVHGIVPDTFRRFTRLAANALPAILLKYLNTYEANLLKQVISSLESDAREVAGVTPTDIASGLINPGCPLIDDFHEIQKIVSVLYKNPKIVDIFLPGNWLVSKMFGLVGAPIMKSSLMAFGGVLRILTGVNCGLIHYATTGSNDTCEEGEHITREIKKGQLRVDIGAQEICGAVPFIPHHMLMYDTFPPIFAQEDVSSTTASSSVNPELTNWQDQAAKTLDTDGAT